MSMESESESFPVNKRTFVFCVHQVKATVLKGQMIHAPASLVVKVNIKQVIAHVVSDALERDLQNLGNRESNFIVFSL